MLEGVVKNIVNDRMFGFIWEPISRLEYFFHKDDLAEIHWPEFSKIVLGSPRYSVRVQFDIVESNKGPRAANVRMI